MAGAAVWSRASSHGLQAAGEEPAEAAVGVTAVGEGRADEFEEGKLVKPVASVRSGDSSRLLALDALLLAMPSALPRSADCDFFPGGVTKTDIALVTWAP